MEKTEHFKTPIWIDYKPEFVKSLIKASNKYIKDAKQKDNEYIKKLYNVKIFHLKAL